MDLHDMFLSKLENAGEDVRFLGVEEVLAKRIGTDSINRFARRYGVNSGSLSRMLNGKQPIPYTLLVGKSFERKTRWVLKNSNLSIVLPKKVTPALGYLLGVLRDGTISNESPGEWTCSFYTMNKAHLLSIQELITQLFGITRKIERFGEVYGIRIRSKTLYFWFTTLFGAKPKQEYWNTPLLIQHASRKIKRAYIAGFFDAEGGVPHLEKMDGIPKRKHLYVKFVQKNREPLDFIKKTLEQEGISMGSVYFSDNKYILKVRMKSIPSFSQLLLLKHPEKSNRLQLLTRLLA